MTRTGIALALVCLLFSLAFGLAHAQDSRTEIRAGQEALIERGFEPGEPDGIIGPQTTAAIRAFQESAGLPVTGRFDAGTLAALAVPADATPEPSASDSVIAAPSVPVLSEPLPQPDLDVPDTADEVLVSIAPAAGGQVAGELIQDLDAEDFNAAPAGGLGSPVYWAMVVLLFIPLIWMIRRTRRRVPAAADITAEERIHRRMMGEHAYPTPRAREVMPVAAEPADDPVDTPDAAPLTGSRDIDQHWVRLDARATVHGVEFNGGLYVGDMLPAPSGQGNDSCLVDPSLEVAADMPDTTGRGLTTYPDYARLPPESRLAYLHWLAGDKSDPDAPIGYVYLYFYGLERRLLIDGAGEETEALVNEVRRLQRVFGHDDEFKTLAANLIDAVDIAVTRTDRKFYGLEPVYGRVGWQIPLRTRLAIGQLIGEGRTIPGDWVFAWVLGHPDNPMVAGGFRVLDDLATLFIVRFDKMHPAGLALRQPDERITADYRAASANFTVALTPFLTKFPDIGPLGHPPAELSELLQTCIADLRPYIDYLATHPDSAESFDALAKLPHDLASARQPPAIQALRTSCNRAMAATGGFVPANALLTELTGDEPDTITPDSLIWAAEVLSRLGIGLAPDPRFAMRLPSLQDPVVLYRQSPLGRGLVEPRIEYRLSLMFATLGHLALLDEDNVPDDERQWMERYTVCTHTAHAAEQERMAANLKWLERWSPRLDEIRNILSDTSNDLRQVLGRMAIARASTRDQIEAAGIRMLRRIYDAIGLDEQTYFAHMRGLAIGDLRDAQIASLTVVGTAPAPIQLDPLRLRAIRRDETRLATILGLFYDPEALARDADLDAVAQSETSTPRPATRDTRNGLDPREHDLLNELTRRSSWPVAAFEIVAQSYGLNPNEAVRTLNNWSTGMHGQAIINDAGPVVVDTALLNHQLLPDHSTTA